jgi:hypothetical protein
MSARSCNGALNLQPRDVHKACVKGKLFAFEQSCLPTCLDEKWKGKIEAGNSFQACQDFAKKPSPNHHLSWCRKGFDDYYRKITSDIQNQVKEVIAEQIKAIENEASLNSQLHGEEQFTSEDEGNTSIQDQKESTQDGSKGGSLHEEQDELRANRVTQEVETQSEVDEQEIESTLEEAKIKLNPIHETSEGEEEPSKKHFEVEILGDEMGHTTVEENNVDQLENASVANIDILLTKIKNIQTRKESEIDTSIVRGEYVNHTTVIDSRTDSIIIQNNSFIVFDETAPLLPNEL